MKRKKEVMIRAIVVDDEWYNLEEISDLIDKTGFVKVVKKYNNPLEALKEIAVICPEVAFIDIEMPEIDGLTLAEKIQEINPKIMIAFITSWNKYAVQAFDLNAIDYIMKPIRVERFNQMIKKIHKEVDEIKNPNVSSNVCINTFGKFETCIGEVPVKWERAKAEELFAYLVMNHGSYIHKDVILEDLWPDYPMLRALPILQTSICKIRNVLSQINNKILITYSGNKYCLNLTNAECDYFEVVKVLNLYEKNRITLIAPIEKDLSLIQKGFLSQQGYIWSIKKDEELRNRFIQIFKEIALWNFQQGNIKEQIRILMLLTKLIPYDEEVNYTILNTLKEFGDNNTLNCHYQWLEKVLKEEFDTEPSSFIKKIMG